MKKAIVHSKCGLGREINISELTVSKIAWEDEQECPGGICDAVRRRLLDAAVCPTGCTCTKYVSVAGATYRLYDHGREGNDESEVSSEGVEDDQL